MTILRTTSATALLAAAAIASAGTAQAETDFGGVTVDGFVEFNYSVNGPYPGVSFMGSGDITVPFSSGFGFSLGLDGLTDFAATTFYTYYPALYYETDMARLSVGIPRSVIEQGYLPEDPFGTSSTAGWALGINALSTTHQTFLIGGFVPPGARIDAAFGNTEVGLSYNRVLIPGPDRHDFAIAARHEFGSTGALSDVALSGAFEYATGGAPDNYALHLGAEASWDKLSAGMRYTHMWGLIPLDTLVLFGDYAITDQFSVDAAFTHLSGIGSATFLSAGAQYDFLQGAYVDANVTVDLNGVASTVYEASLGWKF